MSAAEQNCACMPGLGAWGQWGNQVFQYLYLRLFCEQYGYCPCVPAKWEGRKLVPGGFDLRSIDADEHSDLPVVADRPVLSHPSFRKWIVTRRPLRDVGNKEWSGRDLRRRLPQVNGECLITITPEMRKASCRAFLAASAEVQAALKDIISEVAGLHGVVLAGVHLRLRNYTVLDRERETQDPTTTLPLHSRFKEGSCPYSAPNLQIFVDWALEISARTKPSKTLVVMCSDDVDTAMAAFDRTGLQVLSPLAIVRQACASRADAAQVLESLPAFYLDWLFLSACNVAAVSNSTFSFSACMMNDPVVVVECAADYPGRFVRHCGSGGTLEAFDPWDATPLLLGKGDEEDR